MNFKIWLTKEWDKLGAKKSKEALAAGRKQFGSLALYVWRLMSVVSSTYSNDNSYATLLSKLAEEDDEVEKAYINFNYDTLLDKALVSIYNYDLSGQLNKYTNVNYLKPHGSVNWFVPLRDNDPLIEVGDRGKLEIVYSRMASNLFKDNSLAGNYRILDPLNQELNNTNVVSSLYSNDRYGFPLVMLPLSAKMYTLVDGFLDRMKAEINRIMPVATEIYVIGYRGNDDLIKEILTKAPNNIPLHVVGVGDAHGIQEKLLSIWPGKFTEGNVFTEGFKSFVDNL